MQLRLTKGQRTQLGKNVQPAVGCAMLIPPSPGFTSLTHGQSDGSRCRDLHGMLPAWTCWFSGVVPGWTVLCFTLSRRNHDVSPLGRIFGHQELTSRLVRQIRRLFGCRGSRFVRRLKGWAWVIDVRKGDERCFTTIRQSFTRGRSPGASIGKIHCTLALIHCRHLCRGTEH